MSLLGNYSNETKPNEFNLFTSDDPPIKTFIFGTSSGPFTIDPQNAWDSDSFNVIDQVCEGLFAYNLTNPENEIIPNLATGDGTWSADNLNYTVHLRTGVSFHDGTAFNASAVKWNWERMDWCLNTTGTNHVKVTPIRELYVWPDGTPIVDHTEVVSEHVIKFVLNAPYAPFQALLCFSGSYIQSPASTTKDAYLVTTMSDLVGTGPFVYDTYEGNIEVVFNRYANYWKGVSKIDKLVFAINANSTKRNDWLLSKDIHFLSDPLPEYYDNIASDPDLTFLDQNKTGLVKSYLGMNNKQINTTIRKAISYAINYTYIIDVLKEGSVERLKSPIPLGIRYANWTFDVPILNFSYARQVMQSIGFGVGWNVTPGSSDEANWQAATFLTYNYTYNIENQFEGDLLVLLQDNLGKIGINVIDAGMTFLDLLYRLYEVYSLHRNMVQLYWLGWGMGYNDPSNFIYPLFTNRSVASNGVQYNGYTAAEQAGRDPLALNDNVQLLMEAGLSEIDPVAREAIYDRIQELLIEHDRPWVWGYVEKIYDASHVALSGFQQNVFRKLNFYSCQWNYYNYSMEITHPQDINYVERSVGNTITWSITAKDMYNTTYSIYINDILNQTGSWEVGVPIVVNIDNHSVNVYNYRIEAKNWNEEIEDTVYVVVNPLTVQISYPDDVSYIYGHTGNSITWYIITNLELNTIYYVYQNDTLFDTGGWQSSLPVTINIDNFTEGSYEFRIEAHSGSIIEDDIVIVTVIPKDPITPTDPIIPGFDVFIISFTAIIGIGLILWQAKRKFRK